MKVFTKYISREFIKYQLFCLFIFISLYLLIFFVQKIDDLVENNAFKAEVILPYFLSKIPYIMVLMMPVATLISVIILFHMMKKNREVMAIKSCGINIVKLIQTAVIVSLFVSLFAFLFSETVVPYSVAKSNEIWQEQVEKEDTGRFYSADRIWYKSSDSDAIFYIKHFDGIRKIMEAPMIYFFDKKFKLIRKIDAKRAVWQNGVWRLEEGRDMTVRVNAKVDESPYEESPFANMILNIREKPDDFLKKIKQPEEMTYTQLAKYAEDVKNDGYDNTSNLVELHKKIAFPLISFVLTLLGIPIALKLDKGGIPLAVASGMGLVLLYYVAMTTSWALGLSRNLPPLLSAWTANLLFILVGIYFIMTVEQ
jgi:lipopolysaccharide export system permease protein